MTQPYAPFSVASVAFGPSIPDTRVRFDPGYLCGSLRAVVGKCNLDRRSMIATQAHRRSFLVGPRNRRRERAMSLMHRVEPDPIHHCDVSPSCVNRVSRRLRGRGESVGKALNPTSEAGLQKALPKASTW